MDYKTIANDGIVEKEIKKSRFICHLKRIGIEEEGREYIAQIKKEHHKANHSCSAMIVGDDGQIKRSSDDGEPSGTAGVPMLTVLEKQGLTNVVAVVTRYFGGIKLGAVVLSELTLVALLMLLKRLAELKSRNYQD